MNKQCNAPQPKLGGVLICAPLSLPAPRSFSHRRRANCSPASNVSPISEFRIQRWNSVTHMWETIKDQLPASVTSYVDDDGGNGLAAGTRYFYRIRAVNAGGNGAWSTLRSAVTDDAE